MSDPNLLVLASLAGGEKHGYLIMRDVEAFAGVRLGPGTLYGAITRLEELRLIRPTVAKERRQPYVLTSAGRKYLAERLSALNAVVSTGVERLRRA
jgi:DNA-binding PadR family transcriptional regulator